MNEVISVIIPVYNVEKYLERCVESVVNQTYKDIEIILVDDGSPDNCPAMCDEWEKKNSRIKVIHKQNGGLSDARNAGIEYALKNSDSEWITFIDSDDWVHEKYIEALYNAASGNNCNISVCSYALTDGITPDVNENNLSAQILSPESFYVNNNTNAVIACGKLYKINNFKEIRFPIGKLHEDEFTTYKILFTYDSLAVVNEPLYAYFQNSKSITGVKWTPDRAVIIDALLEQAEFFKENRFEKAYSYALRLAYKNADYCLKEIKKCQDNRIIKNNYPALKKKRRIIFKKCTDEKIYSFKDNKNEYINFHPILLCWLKLLLMAKEFLNYRVFSKFKKG